MQAAWGIEASYAATGGSIPLVNALHQAVPEAELLLLGTHVTATRTSTRRTSGC